ncbi:Ribosome maturation protein SBDS, N-terminal [Phytophthora cactorum]|nr:Ribosome maturation protein SBDS, N-terminal [Phytophthora cactorum]
MSGGRISQPVGKIVLTNVAIVRMRKGGKRFEIACYKNKVFNWRNGVEEDIDEVLQIAKVYENVSKGKFAKKSDWSKAFGVQSEEQACRAILDHGELQVSEGERKALVENMYRDIATIVADKCVNPRPTAPAGAGVDQETSRAHSIGACQMKVQVTTPASGVQAIKTGLLKEGAEIVEQTGSETVRMVVLITPGSYRIVNSLVQEQTAGQGSLEVIDLKSHQEGEHTIDDEISQKTERLGLTSAPAVATSAPAPVAAASGETKKARPCSTCGGDFSADMSKYREHFRSEWHRYNLKRKSKKQPVISEEEFNELDAEDVEAFLSSMS